MIFTRNKRLEMKRREEHSLIIMKKTKLFQLTKI